MTGLPWVAPQPSWPAKVARELPSTESAEFELWVRHNEIFHSAPQAIRWAHQELARCCEQVGGDPEFGWDVQLYRAEDGFGCSISQVSWPGDHTGSTRRTGAEAVIQAVIELKLGY